MVEGPFINFTNHPSTQWSLQQKEEACKFGKIIDMPFPAVDPGMTKDEVCHLAQQKAKEICELKPSVVLAAGEFTLCFGVVSLLQKQGVQVVSACSERMTYQSGNEKTSVFEFMGFREYPGLSE